MDVQKQACGGSQCAEGYPSESNPTQLLTDASHRQLPSAVEILKGSQSCPFRDNGAFRIMTNILPCLKVYPETQEGLFLPNSITMQIQSRFPGCLCCDFLECLQISNWHFLNDSNGSHISNITYNMGIIGGQVMLSLLHSTRHISSSNGLQRVLL